MYSVSDNLILGCTILLELPEFWVCRGEVGVISQRKKEGTHDSEVTGRWSDSEGADKPGYTPPEEKSDRKSVATE